MFMGPTIDLRMKTLDVKIPLLHIEFEIKIIEQNWTQLISWIRLWCQLERSQIWNSHPFLQWNDIYLELRWSVITLELQKLSTCQPHFPKSTSITSLIVLRYQKEDGHLVVVTGSSMHDAILLVLNCNQWVQKFISGHQCGCNSYLQMNEWMWGSQMWIWT